jgi:ABC-type multidrug transport system fused ATPase/permease subunit
MKLLLRIAAEARKYRLLLFLGALSTLFRFLGNYLPHIAAWQLVRDLRMKVYNQIQGFSLSFFHKRQTGDLMSRVVNDTATFEQLYAHVIPETMRCFTPR